MACLYIDAHSKIRNHLILTIAKKNYFFLFLTFKEVKSNAMFQRKTNRANKESKDEN